MTDTTRLPTHNASERPDSMVQLQAQPRYATTEYDPPLLISRLSRFWWLILAITVVAAAVGYAIAANKPKTYEATAHVLITQGAAAVVTGPNVLSSEDPKRYTATQQSILGSDTVRAAAAAALGSTPPKAVVTAGADDVVDVAVNSQNATYAAKAADAYVTAYLALLNGQTSEQLAPSQKLFQARVTDLQKQIAGLSDEIAKANAKLAGTVGATPQAIANAAANNARIAAETASMYHEQDGLSSQLVPAQASLDRVDSALSLGSLGARQLAPAAVPSSTAGPRPARSAALAGLAGFVLSCLLGSGLSNMRPRRQRHVDVS